MAKNGAMILQFQGRKSPANSSIFPSVIVNFLVYLLKTFVGEVHEQEGSVSPFPFINFYLKIPDLQSPKSLILRKIPSFRLPLAPFIFLTGSFSSLILLLLKAKFLSKNTVLKQLTPVSRGFTVPYPTKALDRKECLLGITSGD